MPNTHISTWKKALADIIKTDFEPGATIKLEELYAYKSRLEEVFPNNHHVEAKIRQQCQFLRNDGLLKFTHEGEYLYTGGFENDFKLLSSLNGSVISDYEQKDSLAILNVANESILVAKVAQDEAHTESETKVETAKIKRAWKRLRAAGQITSHDLEQIVGNQLQVATALLASLPDISVDENGDLTQNEQAQHPVGTLQKQGSGEIIGQGVISVEPDPPDEQDLILHIKELSERNLQIGERSRQSRARLLVRDITIANALKKLYNGECQICRFTIELLGNKRYSEHHHIQAKSKGGQDIASNLIVVCPNHHTILDYNVGVVREDKSNWTFTYRTHTDPLLLNKHLGKI